MEINKQEEPKTRMVERIYYMICNDAGSKYGGFDTLEKAMKSINTIDVLNNDDHSYNHIIKVTEKSEEVYRRKRGK